MGSHLLFAMICCVFEYFGLIDLVVEGWSVFGLLRGFHFCVSGLFLIKWAVWARWLGDRGRKARWSLNVTIHGVVQGGGGVGVPRGLKLINEIASACGVYSNPSSCG